MVFKNLRVLGVVLAIFGTASVMFGSPIDANQAKELAAKFRNSGKIKMKTPKAVTTDQLSLSYTAKSSAGDCFYIFNTESDNGYTIVAADDRIEGILAYSEEGNFNPKNIPDNMKWWLDEYQRQIEYYLNNPEKFKITKKKMPEMPVVAPKTTTKWNQSEPYNNDCPMVGGQRSVTGCVATAMAQVMKYRNWPEKPVGAGGGVTFNGTTYDWANMIDVYEAGKYNTIQANAVATLMRQCGASVDMQYSPNASGAYSFDVGPAFYNNFGYDNSVEYDLRDYFTYDVWVQKVYNEIVTNGPLYYSGQSNEGGHAFVADGYSGNGYFHFNWGWGGYQDGYFRLFALNPTSGGIGSFEGGYNTSQSIYTNLKKAVSNNSPFQVLLVATDGYFYTNNTLSIDNGGLFYNPTGRTENLNIAIKLKNIQNDKDSLIFGSFPVDLETNYGFRSLDLSIPNTLANGTYKMNIVYQDKDATDNIWYDVMTVVGTRAYVLVVKNGSNIEVTNPTIENGAKLIVNSLESAGKVFYVNTENYFDIVSSNVGSTDFRDVITMNIYKDLSAERPTRKFNVSVINPAGISVTTSLAQYVPVGEGDFYVIFRDPEGNDLNDPIKITFVNYDTPVTETSKLYSTEVTPNSMTIGTKEVDLTFTLYNYGNSAINCILGVELCSLDDNSVAQKWQSSSTLSIKTGSSRYRFTLNIGDELKPGYYYWRMKNNLTNEIISENIFIKINGEAKTVDGVSYIPYTATNAEISESMIGGYNGSIVIPTTIGGYEVNKINGNAFTFASNLKELTLPSNISTLDNGLFYLCSDLYKLTLDSKTVPSVTTFTFGPDAYKNIELNVANGLANEYKQADVWSNFSFPTWDITLDNIKVGGLAIDPSTGKAFTPYYVSPQEELTITYPVFEGDEVTYEYSIGNGSTVTKVAENGKIVLPALGKENGKLKIYFTKQTGVNTLVNDDDKVTVVTTDGVVVLKNADSKELTKLPKGIYIINGKKEMVK